MRVTGKDFQSARVSTHICANWNLTVKNHMTQKALGRVQASYSSTAWTVFDLYCTCILSTSLRARHCPTQNYPPIEASHTNRIFLLLRSNHVVFTVITTSISQFTTWLHSMVHTHQYARAQSFVHTAQAHSPVSPYRVVKS